MADFNYRAAQRDGQIVEGRIAASDEQAAIRLLRSQGLTPIRIQMPTGSSLSATPTAIPREDQPRLGLRRKPRPPSQDDVLHMTKELAVLLRAGLPLDRALKVILNMNGQPAMQGVLQEILDAIKGGRNLSHALRAHGELFGDFYINMVRSGEAGGQLAEVLAELAQHLERGKALRASLTSALIYPSILLVVSILSIALMLGFVVPQFKSLFEDMGERLPLATRWVVDSGDWMADYGGYLLIAALPLWLIFRRWKATPEGRIAMDRISLRLPLLGPILLKYEITRFARTLGTLLSNGVSLLEAIGIARDTVGNSLLREALDSLPAAIKQGGRMATALEKTGLFTQAAIQMIAVGEESGRLDAMLKELAHVYDDEVQASVKRTLTLLEPLLILGLGAIIATIIIAILMGILSVNELVA
ncbi:MAG: type II secretion system F family protein [Pseudomonadota bacterium]|jgi:general secretion pathway protein F